MTVLVSIDDENGVNSIDDDNTLLPPNNWTEPLTVPSGNNDSTCVSCHQDFKEQKTGRKFSLCAAEFQC